MKTHFIQKTVACLLLLGILCSLAGCSSGSSIGSRPNLNTNFTETENTLAFQEDDSPALTLSEEGVQQVLTLTETPTEYPYREYYQEETILSRLDFDASVAQHARSALNDAGLLDANHLKQLIVANNTAFMQEKHFGYAEVEDDYLAEICRFIVEIAGLMQQKQPDLDWQRIYCNLAHLKILYNTGMLSYAQVNKDLVLSISKNNTQIILKLKGEDGFTRVLTHEIMHIFQVGCPCEDLPEGARRAGFCVHWGDLTFNSGDWTWFVEGSAERNMCKLTGGDAVTYQYKMDYLCSMTLSTLLKEQLTAEYMDNISFYSDPDLLFDAFSRSKEEMILFMTTMQILQIQPEAFFLDYQEKTGIDLRETDDTLNEFCYKLKPAVCITLAKEFYHNLALHLQEHEMKQNDLFFLIAMFEATMNQHLGYAKDDRAEINAPFMDVYLPLRSTLFQALGEETETQYLNYSIFTQDGTLNAGLNDLPQDKKDFLAERAAWLKDLMGQNAKIISN